MQLCTALGILVAAVGSSASQPAGEIAIAAVTEARDELKLVVQQLGQQQEQINELTTEVAELRAAKNSSPATSMIAGNESTVDVGASIQLSSNKTSGSRKVLASLRATADRAEHVLVEERPRTPWWAEKQHTKGPDGLPGGGGYFGESDTDPTFGRHKYYPAGWRLDPYHQPHHSVGSSGSFDVIAPPVNAQPPSPSPPQAPVPTLPPLPMDASPPVELAPAKPAQTSSAAPPLPDPSGGPPPSPAGGAPPPPSGSASQGERKSTDLTPATPAQVVPLKSTMGFFGPPPPGTLPNAPAAA